MVPFLFPNFPGPLQILVSLLEPRVPPSHPCLVSAVLNVCAEQLGLSQMDLLSTSVDVVVATYSTVYFEDPGDSVDRITVTPGGERYVASTQDLGPNQSGSVTVSDTGPLEGNSDELGVMIFANGDRGPGERGGATQESELILLRV